MTDIIHITMVRDNLDNLPDYPVPEGFSIRKFRGGEGNIWAEVGAAAGTLENVEVAMGRFNEEFLAPVEDMESRCFFIVHNESGRVAGTAMAWYDPSFASDENYGRVHWVSVDPSFQGKGLAKPLLSAVLRRLAESHTKAVLGTQTFRLKAVNLYLDLGFVPFYKSPTCPDAWRQLAEDLKHPALVEWLDKRK